MGRVFPFTSVTRLGEDQRGPPPLTPGGLGPS